MHRLKLRRRQPRRCVALITFHLVGRAEFFQQPQNPLRAGVIEMMKREHGDFLGCWFERRGVSEVFTRGKRYNPRIPEYGAQSPVYPALTGSLLPSSWRK